MLQSEIDEISSSFLDAWHEYFGQDMFYLPFLKESTVVDDLYGESKGKMYDQLNKIKFCGSIKFKPTTEDLENAGLSKKTDAMITCITMELEEQGLEEIDMNSIIEIPEKSGVTYNYHIIEKSKKVQFSDNFVFTKIGVNSNER